MIASVFRTLLGGIGLAIGVALLSSVSLAALDVPPAPREVPIVDQTNTLSDSQKELLADKLRKERETSGNQIAVLMIKSLENQALEDYSLNVARAWGVGTKANNNGVLVLIVKNDKRMRIEVGTGLEGALTDVQSGRIIRTEFLPQFRQGKYYEGLEAGLTSVIAAIHGEYTAEPESSPVDNFQSWMMVFFGAATLLSWLGSILARSKNWWAGGILGAAAGGVLGLLASSVVVGGIAAAVLAILGLLFDRAVSKNYHEHASRGDSPSWWAGGGYFGGGGSSGGSGGFGGGGFGGGGASGDW